MRRFDVQLPESVEEGLRILADRGAGARVVAGGTDLIPQLRNGMLRPACVVDLSGISELRRLARENGSMSRVAERVGLERTHLYRKLKQLGIRPSGKGEDAPS